MRRRWWGRQAAFEVVPLEIASAYTTLANMGTHASPRAIVAVVDDNGKVVEPTPHPSREAASAQASYLTLDLMKDVVRYGTGAAIWSYGVDGEFAGKTGPPVHPPEIRPSIKR